MLRLHRIQISATDQAQIQPLQQALQLIKKHAVPSTWYFFAQPTVNQHTVDWLSHYSGTIQPYNSLSNSLQEQLLAEANQHLTTVKTLHATLIQQGNTQAAKQLLPLLQPLNTNHLYAVDNRAVYTPSLQSPPPITVTAPTSPTATVAAAPLAATTPNRRGCLWSALLLLSLLLLLIALAWWWFSKTETVETVKIESSPFSTKFACQAEAIEPPDFALIFDTSDSMNLNINISLEEEEWFYATNFDLIDHYPDEYIQKLLRLEQAPSRFTVAKEAMSNMLGSLHNEVPTQLISFETCGEIVDHGTYGSHQRRQLLNTLLGLETRAGTPSAQALRHAAQNMNGVNKDGMIVLVIDGEDGCGDNICEVAQHIAQNQPRIRVNVVDITGFGLSNCVAEHTGGRVYSSNNINKINTMMRESIEEVSIDPNCHD